MLCDYRVLSQKKYYAKNKKYKVECLFLMSSALFWYVSLLNMKISGLVFFPRETYTNKQTVACFHLFSYLLGQ